MSVKVTINGEGLSFEKETDMLKAGQIIAFLSSDTSIQQSGTQQYSSQNGVLLAPDTQRRSPRMALMESDAKTNAEKIVVLANFICERNGTSSFSSKEIQVEFKKAGESLPKNFTRDFNQAVASGYILENDEQGDFILTDLGLEVLSSGFDGFRQNVNGTASKKRKGNKNKRSSTVRSEVTELEIIPQLGGYPDYWSQTVKGVRILWLLAYALESNVPEGLTTVEIDYLASKLRDQIKVGDIPALTKGSVKKGFMTTSKGYLKILKPGEDFLKAQS
jgi:hypothetical protein